jgi:nucleoside-diphosphate-sugar epimerase
MRICVLGGTRFIGRAIVEAAAVDHEVLVVHRGTSEPDDLVEVEHLHVERSELGSDHARSRLRAFDADAYVDTMALTGADAERTLSVLPSDRRLVVLSSMDTYRAYGALHAGTVSDPVPIDETSPVRPEKYPYRGEIPGMDDYDKLDVEPLWLDRGGVVARLPMVTGPHDYQRRQDFVLRRVRHGREAIPFGAGTALLTHGDVGDIARGVLAVIEADDATVSGEVFNLGETATPTVRLRAEQILEAAGAAGTTLVTVADDALPPDLGVTGTIAQPLLVSSAKARERLGWEPTDPTESLARTVAWHLDHPPEGDGDDDFTADDEALASVS